MTRRVKLGFALAAAVTSSPLPALACTACGDHAVRIHHPWLLAATSSLTLWGVVTAILGLVTNGRIQGMPAPVPGRKLTAALALLAFVGGIGGAIVVGSNFLALFGVGALLGLVVLALTVRGLFVRPLPRATVGIAAVHALFAGLACWNGWSAQKDAGSPEHLVSLLSYEIPAVGEVVVPKVVALGDTAVPLLRDRAQSSLAQGNPRPAAYCLFSLEAIGTSKACAALEALLSTKPEPPDSTMRFARFAWARCGEEATRQLMDSYETAPDERRRADLLAALLRSAQPGAVLFAIDHLEVLSKSSGPLATNALRLLEDSTSAQQLRALPVYAERKLGSQTPVGHVAEFFFGPGGDVAPRGVPASELRAKWQALLGPASP